MEHKELLLGLVTVTNKGQELIPHKDYEIKQDGEKFYLVKKKKEYPKTYKECCEVLNYKPDFYDADKLLIYGYMSDKLRSFQKLLVCRDAYWKLYGEEMGLGKPWEPDWRKARYIIYRNQDDIICGYRKAGCVEHHIFEFPTPEMRDAFKENFDPDIEICKELL